MKIINNMSIGWRLNLMLTILLIILFSILGYNLYQSQKQLIIEDTDNLMQMQVEDLYRIYDLQIKINQQKVATALSKAYEIMVEDGGISESNNEFHELESTHLITKERRTERLKTWYLKGVCIHHRTDFVDKVQILTQSTATVFQKTSEGYVPISSTVLDKYGKRSIGTLIPDTMQIIKTIEAGQEYKGRVFVLDEWYLTAYKPIKINNEIKGFLYVGVKQQNTEAIKKIFEQKKYLSSGYPYTVSNKGTITTHPDSEGAEISKSLFFNDMLNLKNGKINYRWPENTEGKQKIQYFKYYEPTENFICVTIYEDDVFNMLDKLRNSIIFWAVLSQLVFNIIAFFIGITITRPISNLVNIIEKMSKGIIVETQAIKGKDEIGKITRSLNVLIEGQKNTSNFAKEIGNNNLEAQFNSLGSDDVLGNSLLEMRNSLKAARDAQEKRKQEDAKRNWITQGLAQFGDILRQNSNNIAELSFSVIKNIIEYLNANQGGIFIYNDNENDKTQAFFELKAAIAYNRRKFINKKVKLGEGLIGICALEKNTMHISNLPDDYLVIESGLGEAKPQNLLLVPLKLESEVLGVIELASLEAFENHQIQFIEEVAKNIALTLISVKVNEQTAQLLKQSQKQSEELATQEEEMRQNLEELQATQEEASRREAELAGVVSALSSNFLLAEYDIEGKFININQQFLDIFKTSKEQVIDKQHFAFYTDCFENYKQHADFWKELKAGRSQKRISILKINKQEYKLSEIYTPIKDNNDKTYKVLNIAQEIRS